MSFPIRTDAAFKDGRTGPSPVDRAEPGSKPTDGGGIPPALSPAGGHRGDVR